MKRSSVNIILFSTELYSECKLMYDVLFLGYIPIRLNRKPFTYENK